MPLLYVIITAIIVSAIMILVIVIIKLKEANKDLANKLSESEKKVRDSLEEIKSLKWKLDHPAKYKTGDKVGNYMITSRKLDTPNLGSVIASLIIGTISVFSAFPIGRKKNIFEMCWKYELTNTENGQKIEAIESDIDSIKNG